MKLEIWGKAQRSPPGALSPIGGEFKGRRVKFPPVAKSRDTHALTCISIRKMRTVDLGWVNISRVISGVSGPNFTNFFLFNAVLIVLDNTFAACR